MRRMSYDLIVFRMAGGDGSWRDPTAHVRMNAVTKDVIEGYYNLVEETLCEHDLTNKPSQIYNMDESGMPLDHRSPNVVAR